MVKVSVITGFYNRGEFLRQTIESILNQTFSDFELICFDDASTDDSAQRLEQLHAEFNDPRFRYIVHAKNTGFTRGMIAAVAQAQGEYIAVQGSADISLPRRLELQAGVLDSRPEVVAVGCWYSNIVYETGVRRLRKPNANDKTFGTLLNGNVFSHGEVMYRKSTYDQVGGYRAAFKFCQDFDLWLRMIKVGKLATVPEELYERFVRYDGVSYAPEKFALQARYSILAAQIAQMTTEKAAEILNILGEHGPTVLVPKEHPKLQRRYVKAALRSVVWGKSDATIQLSEESIVSPVKRTAVIALANFYASP
ncbi:MAG: glycosyltransferase, partial [Proteobacteria bacterium]